MNKSPHYPVQQENRAHKEKSEKSELPILL